MASFHISTSALEVKNLWFSLSTETCMCISGRVVPGGWSLVLSRRYTWQSWLFDMPFTAVTFESILFGWSQQRKKRKETSSSSSLPKFCITVKEMLFLRALHSSYYVIDYKKMRGRITVCIWPSTLMWLRSFIWLEWTTNVVVCWHSSISGTFPDSCLPASRLALLSLPLNNSQC